MNEEMTFNEKRKIVEEFIATINPYEKSANLNFDLHGYSEYIKEHNLSRENITLDVMEMFNNKCN